VIIMIIPFKECIARPDNPDGSRNSLRAHLLSTAFGWGKPGNQDLSTLQFLGGLLHDAGKARWRWQQYIRHCNGSGGKRFPSVNHAPLASAVFMYTASKLLATWNLNQTEVLEMRRRILHISRDIYDHHGELGDIEDEPPWAFTLSLDHVSECDMSGLFDFIDLYFPSLEPCDAEFTEWLREAPEIWEMWAVRSQSKLRMALSREENRFHKAANLCVRTSTSGLIASDRLDAAGIPGKENCITRDMALEAESVLLDHCLARAKLFSDHAGSRAFTELRQKVQDQCVNQFLRFSSEDIFTLILPTGLGKTLTSLRVAMKACQSGLCNRIIYVAPYLSILSQATSEIKRATGLEVLEHHHLSAISLTNTKDKDTGNSSPVDTDETAMLDLWSAPVITTTLNQLFRALFPGRAQHTMRLQALHRAFIIIDEPQVVDRSAWTVFLTMADALVKTVGAKLLFSTATLPPLQPGLSYEPICLAPSSLNAPSRYEVDSLEHPLDEDGVVNMAIDALDAVGSVAVIMNTVGDAYEVYARASPLLSKGMCFLLTGSMTAPHKAIRIKEIKEALRQGQPVLAVCTQIVECGVDLSFSQIFRAVPVLSSIVQAAGRVNRHAEQNLGRVTVFRFLRGGQEDTRRYVYRSGPARDATDVCLESYPTWPEHRSSEVLSRYYSELMARSIGASSLELLIEAACGQWSALGRVDPFGVDYPHVSVYVPFGEELLTPHVNRLLAHYAPEGLDQLYERYLDRGFRASLPYNEKKRFMALMQHFIVPMDEKSAHGRISFDPERPIAILADRNDYRMETGLAHLKGINAGIGSGIMM
jgi:CRISPR-associated endonuclease/helicase Cas3